MSGIVNTADVYSEAVHMAQTYNQVLGEKSDYYLTIHQLEAILQAKQYGQLFLAGKDDLAGTEAI